MFIGAFVVIWLGLVIGGFVALGFLIASLVECVRAPEPAFGPPWDNGKNAWTLGLALGFVIPFGVIVASILWWTQARPALRAGVLVPRPFWAPSRGPMPPPYYGYPPQPPYPPQTPQGPPPQQ